jgi:hypothetical protein
MMNKISLALILSLFLAQAISLHAQARGFGDDTNESAAAPPLRPGELASSYGQPTRCPDKRGCGTPNEINRQWAAVVFMQNFAKQMARSECGRYEEGSEGKSRCYENYRRNWLDMRN